MWTKMKTKSPSILPVIFVFLYLLCGQSPVNSSAGPRTGDSMSATPALGEVKTPQPKSTATSEGGSIRPKPVKVEVVKGTTIFNYDEESFRREMEHSGQIVDASRHFAPSESPEIQSSVNGIDYKNSGESEDYFVADYDNMEYFYEDLAPEERKAEGVDMLQFLEGFLEESETADSLKSEEQMKETVKLHYSQEVKVDEIKAASQTIPEEQIVELEVNHHNVKESTAELAANHPNLEEPISELSSSQLNPKKSADQENLEEPTTELEANEANHGEPTSELAANENNLEDINVELAANEAKPAEPTSELAANEDNPANKANLEDTSAESATNESNFKDPTAELVANEATLKDTSANEANLEDPSEELAENEANLEDPSAELSTNDDSLEDPSAGPISSTSNSDSEDNPAYQLMSDENDVFQTLQVPEESQLDFGEHAEDFFLNDEFWDGKSETEIVQLILKYSQVKPEDLQALFQSEEVEESSELTPIHDIDDFRMSEEEIPNVADIPNQVLTDEKVNSVEVKDVLSHGQDKNEETSKYIQSNKSNELPPNDDYVDGDKNKNRKQISEGLKEHVNQQIPKDVLTIPEDGTIDEMLNHEKSSNSVPHHNQFHVDEPITEEQSSEDNFRDKQVPNNLPAAIELMPGDISDNQSRILEDEQVDHEENPDKITLNHQRILDEALVSNRAVPVDELDPELSTKKQDSFDNEFSRKQVLEGILPSLGEPQDNSQLSGEELLDEPLVSNEAVPLDELDPELSTKKQDSYDNEFSRKQVLEGILPSLGEPQDNSQLSGQELLGEIPHSPELLSMDIEFNTDQKPDEVLVHEEQHSEVTLQQAVEDEEHNQKQIPEDILINNENLTTNLTKDDPENEIISGDQISEDLHLNRKHVQVKIDVEQEDAQKESEFSQIQISKEVPLIYPPRPVKENVSNIESHDPMEDELNVTSDQDLQLSVMKEEMVSHAQDDLKIYSQFNRELDLDDDLENIIELSDESIENHNLILELTKLETNQNEEIFAAIQQHKQKLNNVLPEKYEDEKSNLQEMENEISHELRQDEHSNFKSETNFSIPNERKEHEHEVNESIEPELHSSYLDSELLELHKENDENQQLEDEMTINVSVLKPMIDSQGEVLESVLGEIKINPELEVLLTPFNEKDSVENKNASNVAKSEKIDDSTHNFHLSEKRYDQKIVEESSQHAVDNTTAIQDEQFQNLFTGEDVVTDSLKLTNEIQSNEDSIETTPRNLQPSKESVPSIEENLQEEDLPSNLVSFELPVESTFTQKLSRETINNTSLEQLPVLTTATHKPSKGSNDFLPEFSVISVNESEIIHGEELNKDHAPSMDKFEDVTSYHEAVDDNKDANGNDKHDEDEYVEWLMQFAPSSLHSWSHEVSYSTLFGNVSGDRVVLLMIMAISFLAIFTMNQFIIVSSREKPLIARMAQMDKKLFSTTTALEQERLERCEAKLEYENQCQHVQRLNEKCEELEQELNMAKIEKAESVDKTIKAEKMLAESLLKVKNKDDTEEEENQEQLVGLVSELQAQSKAHKTLLDKYESMMKKKEKELKQFRKENEKLKENLEMSGLEMDKCQKECLEYKDTIEQHLENESNHKNNIDLVYTQLREKQSSLEIMQSELSDLKDKFLILEDEDKRKETNIEELKEMVIVMEANQVSNDNQNSTSEDIRELAKLSLQDRKNTEDKLKKEIADAKEKLIQVEIEFAKVRKENACIRETRDEAAKNEEDAKNKLDVLTEFFNKKETELQKQLSLQSVKHDELSSDSESFDDKFLSVSKELENTKESLKILQGELEAQTENHNVCRAEQEKKSYENWVAARQAERNLATVEGEMRVLRNRLTIAEARNSELLETMKTIPNDQKIKMEPMVNIKPDNDSLAGSEFQPIHIDLPPLPGFNELSGISHLPPLPGALSIPKMVIPTIIPPDIKDARLPSRRRRSQRESWSQYSSCPGSPRNASNPSISGYRSESHSPSRGMLQSNSSLRRSSYRSDSRSSYKTETQTCRADSYSPYRTDSQPQNMAESRSPYRSDLRSPNRIDSQPQIMAESRSPYRAESRSPYRAESRSPYRAESRSPYRAESRSPYRAESRSPYRAESRSPYRAESRSPYRAESRSPYRAESRSPYRSDSGPQHTAESRSYRSDSRTQTTVESRSPYRVDLGSESQYPSGYKTDSSAFLAQWPKPQESSLVKSNDFHDGSNEAWVEKSDMRNK